MTKLSFEWLGSLRATEISHFILVNDLIWWKLNPECLPLVLAPRPPVPETKAP